MILGLTGTICAGKSCACEMLAQQGFRILSFGAEVKEFIKEDLESRGPMTRERMQYWGRRAREIYSTDFWERRLFAKINEFDSERYVVDGFRYVEQVENFRRAYEDFYLVAIDAQPRLRYERMLARARPGDAKNWQEFLHIDARDLGAIAGQETAKCIALADAIVMNNSTLEEFERSVKHVVEHFERARKLGLKR